MCTPPSLAQIQIECVAILYSVGVGGQHGVRNYNEITLVGKLLKQTYFECRATYGTACTVSHCSDNC